ncbi:hypothetical protein [Pedobacter rhodius]|uniref:TROVE domain-containing protein n=1 Tax=Pedobacter rhodius TaxID=3004098 RepID=A0ABT4KUA4_9SPHI|nr:hypothetical protein [Pedobacter sp. SJ11]MCZ4222510.1 hypothetical protein [Pedobacter sp. SJ11]
MTLDIIKTFLTSNKSSERRKGAKEIAKYNVVELGESLFNAYLKESQNTKTWETQVEMILALGLINYKKALIIISKIVLLNTPHSMVSYAGAQTYIRLKRRSLKDAKPIIELLKTGSLSIVDGALNPLGYDKMMPSAEEIKTLIKLSWDLHKHKDRIGKELAYCDPRYGLAAACAGWNKQLTFDFLNHCLETSNGDTALLNVAKNSLKQKYIKLR